MVTRKRKLDWMTIGQISVRTGLAASAIRFYESKGLVSSERDRSGQRRFRRADLRRLSFVMVAQALGFSLSDIRNELDKLPAGGAPSAKDWQQISTGFRSEIDAKIQTLMHLRDNLDGCIGCGCLSMERCALFNANDQAATGGAGPRYLLGDEPSAEAS